MLVLILIFFLCRAFYRLAVAHNRIGWRCATSGFVAFYVWNFLTFVIFFLILEVWQPGSMTQIPEGFTSFLCLLGGAMMSWIYYDNLKASFQKANKSRKYWLMW